MATHVVRNETESRYELQIDGEVVGVADYSLNDTVLTIPHTEITPALRGQGLGEQLVRGVLDDAAHRNMRVVPLCWFVRDFIRDHPSYADLTSAAR